MLQNKMVWIGSVKFDLWESFTDQLLITWVKTVTYISKIKSYGIFLYYFEHITLGEGGGVLPKQKGLCPRDSLGGMFKFQIDWYSKLYFN